MNPTKPFVSYIPSYWRETQQQAKNYKLATQDLLSANILYNVGLYDDSCVLSEQAAEKFLKSCSDITNSMNHNLKELYSEFSQLCENPQCTITDLEFLQHKFYNNRYGDQSGEPSTEEDALTCLKTACSVKEDIDTYRKTPIEDILKFTGENKTTAPLRDNYIRKHQFDGIRTYSNALTSGQKVNL